VDRPDGDVADALRSADGFRVRTVEDHQAVRTDGDDRDCVVVAAEDAETVERLSVEGAPVVATVDPEADVSVDDVLDAGAADAVGATGEDRAALLAHRVRAAVERDRAQARRRDVQARFEALANTPSLAIVTVDAGSTVRFAGPGVEELFGYAPEELEGESLMAIMPDRMEAAHRAAVAEYLETGERSLDWSWIELPARHRDGTEFPVAVSFGERSNGEHLFSAVIRDITDRKEREQRLNRLATAVEGSMDGIAILDDDGVYRYVNDAHAAAYGYDDPERLVGRTWTDLYDESERRRFETEVLPTLSEEGQWRGEATGRRADGSTFEQEVSLTELEDGGIVCVVRDVSERLERRQQLREERQFVESVIDALPDAFYVLNTDGSLRRWNDRFQELTGYTDDELDGMHALEVVPDDDEGMIARAMAAVFQEEEAQTVQSALVAKSGERVPHEFSASPIRDADGEVVGLVGVGRDVSDERLREQRLSVLSRVLRHNVRNRTTVIQGRAQHIASRAESDLRADAEAINEAAADLAETSERARQAERYLRTDRSVREPTDLTRAVEDALESTGVDAETDLPGSATVIATGRDALAHAVAELLRNTRDHVADPTVRVTVTVDGTAGRVRIEDDGPGIPESELAAVESGEETDLAHGSGLGLWLVAWVVTAAGGSVEVDESDLGGAAVELSFPAA